MASIPFPTNTASSTCNCTRRIIISPSSPPPFISFPRNYYSSILSLQPKQANHTNLHSSSPENYSLIHSKSVRAAGLPLTATALNAKSSETSGEEENKALEVVLRLYSALKNNNIRELSDIIGDECRCVCNFVSFFQAFHGKKQVLGFFSFLVKCFGNNIQIVVKPTLTDGMNVGVSWKIELKTIHLPLGKGFSFHICQSYRGKVLIRNVEMFMEPLLHFEPLRLKMIAQTTAIIDRASWYITSEINGSRVLWVLFVLLSFAALTILRLLSPY